MNNKYHKPIMTNNKIISELYTCTGCELTILQLVFNRNGAIHIDQIPTHQDHQLILFFFLEGEI